MKFRIVERGYLSGKFFIQKKVLGLFWAYYKEPLFAKWPDGTLCYCCSERREYDSSAAAACTIYAIGDTRSEGRFYRGNRTVVGWSFDRNSSKGNRVFVKVPMLFGLDEPFLRDFETFSYDWEQLKRLYDSKLDERKKKKLAKEIAWVSNVYNV